MRDVFQGHATVQHQGSTAKGTGMQDKSDWDFFVQLDSSIPTVTQRQRMTVVQQLKQHMAAARISYSIQCGENRVRMCDGSDGVGRLPDVDIVFSRYKADQRLAPNSKALATSHEAQKVGSRNARHRTCTMQAYIRSVCGSLSGS